MNFKKLYYDLLFYLSVPKCVCCDKKLDKKDLALCPDCLFEYRETKKRRCSVCKKLLYECSCTNNYLDRHMIHKLIKVFRYSPSESFDEKKPSNELIYKIKRGYRHDLLDFISDEICDSIKNCLKYEKYIITNVPRSAKRRKKYGIDHSKEIAKAVARKLEIEYLEILSSKARKPQKKTFGEERIKNAEFSYKNEYDLSGERVIIVDDIVTSGASLGASAILIKGLGAKEVVGACLGIAYKEPYTPFSKEDRFSKK